MMRELIRALSPLIVCSLLLSSCRSDASNESADILLTGGKVYTLNWDDPATDGAPAKNAPYSSGVWKPDAEVVAVRGSRIMFVEARATPKNIAARRLK